MAPRNSALSKHNKSGHEEVFVLSNGNPLTDFSWQKTMIQSRIMEKVQNVGDRISSQSWLEQMRMLVKERSFSSFLLIILIGLCTLPVIAFVLAMAFTFFGFIFVEGTLLTIGCCLLGGLLIVAACLALPVMLVLYVTYSLSSMAFNLFSTTGSRLNRKNLPTRETTDSSKNTPNIWFPGSRRKSCAEGNAFLPACITESDYCLEQIVQRREADKTHWLLGDTRIKVRGSS